MRSRFDDQLALLNRELTHMGALCENSIATAVKALVEGGEGVADKAKQSEELINQKEREIETLCLKLLLQQQPVAKDLRQISSALKMITDMERIGDQATDIAEIVCTANIDTTKIGELFPIAKMAEETIKMVTDSIEAFVKKDIELARAVIDHDDVVDKLFFEIKKSLMEVIADKNLAAVWAVDVLMIAKYLERIGDHATNVAEWVEFSITGEHKQ